MDINLLIYTIKNYHLQNICFNKKLSKKLRNTKKYLLRKTLYVISIS